MNARKPPNNHVVLHDNMTCQGCDIGHDDVIAQLHIVGNVDVCEQVIVRTDTSGIPFSCRTVNRHMLTDGIPVSDPGMGYPALPLQIRKYASRWLRKEKRCCRLLFACGHRPPHESASDCLAPFEHAHQ